MNFPFGRAGTPHRPSLMGITPGALVEIKPYRGKARNVGLRFMVTSRGQGAYERDCVIMSDSVIPLRDMLRGLGFTLADCRAALDEEG